MMENPGRKMTFTPQLSRNGASLGMRVGLRRVLALVVFLGLGWFLSGCKDGEAEQALDSDANGYQCLSCQAKFYTERSVFAAACPECRKPNIEQAMGYVCDQDNAVTVAPRGVRSVKCRQCQANTTGMSIPRQADFVTWGATKRAAAEVGSP
jgi:hypothetical protein